MRIALDAKRYVDLCKGVEETVRLVSTAEAVLQHNLRFHDRDRHFDRLPQIVRV